jgi:hypothetical protein
VQETFDEENHFEVATETATQKKNVLQSMTEYFKNWFEDERVNGDFQ